MPDWYIGLSIPALVSIGAALAVMFLFWGFTIVVSRRLDPARRRIADLGAPEGVVRDRGLGGRIADAVRPVERFVMPRGAERESTQERLRHAGLRSPTALPVFYGIKILLLVMLVLIWIACAYFLLPTLRTGYIVYLALAVAFIGLIAPNVWLNARVTARQRLLRNGFPDALDLLTVCVESGLGLAQALQRVADELEVSHPELAEEFAQVTAQMRAGVEREAALRGLATRTGLEDIRGFVSLMVQTLRFGTGIAETLRVYSAEFRDRRMQRAEEAAAKIGTKLIFPLVLCLFPSFFLVAIGPAVIRLVEAFSFVSTRH